MILLYKDPQGKNIFSGTSTVPSSSVTPAINDARDQIKASENSI